MRKIAIAIIVICSLFSTWNNTFASNGAFEKLLWINASLEKIDISLQSLEKRNIKNEKLKWIYDKFIFIDNALKWEITKQYQNGRFDYYATKGIIKNHWLFVYYVDQLIDYLELKVNNPESKDLDENIINSYSNIRIYYNKMRYLISEEQTK